METTVLYVVIAAVFGLLVGYLVSTAIAATNMRRASDDWSTKLQAEKDAFAKRETDLVRLSEQIVALQDRLRESASQLDAERSRLDALQVHLREAEGSIASGKTENDNLLKRLDEEKQRLEAVSIQMKQDFENLANSILENKVQRFTNINHEKLSEIIAPFKEKIAEFERKVDLTNKEQNEGRAALFERLKSLEELNKSLSAEALNLTQALRGDNKAAGDWGEMVLERILQDSGLSDGVHYTLQESFTGENGRQRPDAVIYLPDSKNLIIDSKVSLKAYSDWAGATDEIERERFRKEHFTSVKNHMTGLVSKKYTDIEGLSTPDFVIMFIPNDAAFMLALQHDRTLYDQAYKQRITIVGPSNLMAVMMTIDHLWKQENQRKNMLEIADRGAALLDKFSSFIESMDEIGNRLGQAEKAYNEAKSRLYTGTGNLVGQATKLRDLGVKAKKQLPEAE